MIGRFLARRRARRDYEAFERVLKHACLSRQFRDTPASRIGALEALKLWWDDRIEAPSIWETIGEPAPIFVEPREVRQAIPAGYEDPGQIDLLEAAMGLTSARVP